MSGGNEDRNIDIHKGLIWKVSVWSNYSEGLHLLHFFGNFNFKGRVKGGLLNLKLLSEIRNYLTNN